MNFYLRLSIAVETYTVCRPTVLSLFACHCAPGDRLPVSTRGYCSF